jgi:phage tail protein X
LTASTTTNLTGLLYGTGATISTSSRLINGVTFSGSSNINTDEWISIYNALGSAIVAQEFPITLATTTLSMTNQRQYFQAFWLTNSATLNGVKWYQTVAGNFTASNFNGVALYTYSAGTLTMVASSANDATGTLWKTTANTIGSKTFSSTYQANPGLYYVSYLYSNGSATTTPTIAASTAMTGNGALNNLDFTNSGKLSGFVSSTSLTASILSSALTANTVAHAWMGIY